MTLNTFGKRIKRWRWPGQFIVFKTALDRFWERCTTRAPPPLSSDLVLYAVYVKLRVSWDVIKTTLPEIKMIIQCSLN